MENIPRPCKNEVEKYLILWDSLENYVLQEKALDKLFFEIFPSNDDINGILIKCSSLNDFYSTNIFSVFPVAKHILKLDIDNRLKNGDASLVNDIANIMISVKNKCFYSFATKYCSHHFPSEYPIYDYYVERVLTYFKKIDNFCDFKLDDLDKARNELKNIILQTYNEIEKNPESIEKNFDSKLYSSIQKQYLLQYY